MKENEIIKESPHFGKQMLAIRTWFRDGIKF